MNDRAATGNSDLTAIPQTRVPRRLRFPGMADRPTAVGVAEALLGTVAISTAGILIPRHWGLLDLQPHPLWIVVIGIAVRYGAASGYTAGAAAAASYMMFLCFTPELHLHPPRTPQLAQPFLLLTVGIALSELAGSQRRRLATTEARYQQAMAMFDYVVKRQRALSDQKSELERRILDQSTSLPTLYHVAKSLHVLDVEAVYQAIVEVVSSVFAAEACALYLCREDGLELWTGSPQVGRPAVLHAPTGVLGRALRERRVVTIHDRLKDEDPLAASDDDDPVVMAGPLLDRGQILGIVAVERLPFERLSRASTRTFQLILDWSSVALLNAVAHTALQRKPRRRSTPQRSDPLTASPKSLPADVL